MQQNIICPNEVLERIAAEYGTLMFRTCCMYLKNEDVAQDAVQDAFIKIYKAWPCFQNLKSEKAWVMRVTANVCKDYLRCAWNRRVILVEEYPEHPVDRMEEQDDTDLLIAAVRKLSPKYRQVVLMRYYMGFQVKEIAAALNAPQTTVSMRLKRAREKLKSAIEYAV